VRACFSFCLDIPIKTIKTPVSALCGVYYLKQKGCHKHPIGKQIFLDVSACVMFGREDGR